MRGSYTVAYFASQGTETVDGYVVFGRGSIPLACSVTGTYIITIAKAREPL